jgi:hypothetical protein
MNNIWIQGLLSFGIWIGYGLYQRKRAFKLKAWTQRVPVAYRTLLAIAMLLASLVLLFGGFILLSNFGQLSPDGMSFFGWLSLTAVGLAFVHLQMSAASLLVSKLLEDQVTASGSDPSNSTDTK